MTAPIDIRLHEWGHCDPTTQPALAGRFLVSEQARARARHVAHMLDVRELKAGLSISARSHVGRIDLGTIRITVVPKLPGPTLLALFRYAYGLRDLRLLGASRFATSADATFHDLVCAQLLAEATELIERGLQRRYEARRDDLASPRGRIDINVLARRGGVDRASLPCQHHPRLQDHLINRVLLAGLELASKITLDVRLRSDLRRLARRMSGSVDRVPLTNVTLQRAQRQMNRLLWSYRASITLIELLVADHSPSLEDDAALPLCGFMFDMNRFFQELVSRLLGEHLGGYEVLDEHGLVDMMRYMPGWNPRRLTSPRPRPDFVVRSKGRTVAILDAKYRDLWAHKLPREMLYQLALYALSRGGGGSSAIIYPTLSVGARESRIEISDPTGAGHPAHVALRPLNLVSLKDALLLPHTAKRRRLAEIAKRLAFSEGTSRAAADGNRDGRTACA